MIDYLRKKFALSKKGAANLIKAMLCCALTDLSFMFPVGLLYIVLKNILEDRTYSIGIYIAISVVLLAIIYWCQKLQYNATFLASYEESADKRISMAEKLRKIPLAFFEKKDLSDLTTTLMGDCAALETAFSHFIPQLVGSILSVCVIGISLLIFDYRLAIALLWVVPAAFIITMLGKNSQKRMNKKNYDSLLRCADTIQECIENIKEIKANNQEVNYLKNVDTKLDLYERINIKSELNTAKFVVTSQMLLKVGIATLTLEGANLIVSGQVDFLTFLMFLIAASRVFDPLAASLENLAAIYSTELKVARMNEVDNQKEQTGSDTADFRDYNVKFNNVVFAYDDEQVLNGVTFEAKQGEVTALVGPSGGGKSTVSKLAARFWDVNKGKITIGGKDISLIKQEELLQKFSIVFQDVVLFNSTIMENIRLGKKGATDEEVILAAKAACCDDFIKKLPNGYNTIIGENGSMLSGGERQRISIARALLKNAPIILLDEATASLDVESETKVQKAISTLIKNKTVLVIAHKMRTIAGADNIVVLAEGKVKEQGTHEELLKKEGIYNNLWTLQNKSAQWTV